MYARHRIMVIHSRAKQSMPMSMSKQKLQIGHEDMTKAQKFDIEVKSQHQIGIMNLRDT